MTRPRSSLVSVRDTPFYHCIGRCVRRAFLCGQDPVSGRSFDHRKQLILERLRVLTDVFAIDLCAYALMGNHYHLVVRLVPDRASAWTDREVIERWRRLYAGPPCVAQYLDGKPLAAVESSLVVDCIARWRNRLADLSWFMRCLNEHIARLANAEDGCTGRFWEGRFKSQALLDETALLTAMAYVDLNPVRAGIAESIPDSDFTSGQRRLREITPSSELASINTTPALQPFAESIRNEMDDGLPFNLQDYLDLIDATGRILHPRKRGVIPDSTPRLLRQLGISPTEWVKSVSALRTRFALFIGAPHRLLRVAEHRGWRWIRGQASARRLYQQASR